MRRIYLTAGALLALGACRAPRAVQAVEETTEAVRRVEAVCIDSLDGWMIVELEEPRLTLRRDSVVELRASAARTAARVKRRSSETVAAADTTARHSAVTLEQPQPVPRKAGRSWRWIFLLCAALIALSWRGIRLRR
ncbi:MAG: hypothetical protein K2L99_07050 [Muribaculaceae bacterium]|nr:hypothetical protein [Muribaculaceae bacterium]